MSLNEEIQISVIMVDGGFREKFHAIDFIAKQTFPPQRYEIIWVEYYDRLHPELADRLRKYSNCRSIILGRHGTYHSSCCFNAGIKAALGPLIIIPDADLVFPPDFLEQVRAAHQDSEKMAMYVYRFDEPRHLHQDLVNLEHLRNVCVLNNPDNYGGCLTIQKKWLLKLNGYELHPAFASGFHANGLDVYSRIKSLGLQVMWHPKLRTYHPWHPFSLENRNTLFIQKQITRYRARSLRYLPYMGIDAEQDSMLPGDLQKKIHRYEKIGTLWFSKPMVAVRAMLNRWLG